MFLMQRNWFNSVVVLIEKNWYCWSLLFFTNYKDPDTKTRNLGCMSGEICKALAKIGLVP